MIHYNDELLTSNNEDAVERKKRDLKKAPKVKAADIASLSNDELLRKSIIRAWRPYRGKIYIDPLFERYSVKKFDFYSIRSVITERYYCYPEVESFTITDINDSSEHYCFNGCKGNLKIRVCFVKPGVISDELLNQMYFMGTYGEFALWELDTGDYGKKLVEKHGTYKCFVRDSMALFIGSEDNDQSADSQDQVAEVSEAGDGSAAEADGQ
ncbi:MAG: hypothetical protein J6P70_05315 [Ruminobacter sp.]|nr:hypothetical protein [Ruminobacter sp.]